MSTPDDTCTGCRETLPDNGVCPRCRPLCIACDQRPATDHSLACKPCLNRAVRILDEIADGFGRLDPTPGSAGLDAAPSAPGFRSKSPARDDVLVLTDRRRAAHDPEQPANASSLLRTVGWWAEWGRDDGAVDPRVEPWAGVPFALPVDPGPPTVEGECFALAASIGSLARRWWFGEMLRNLDAAAGHLRRALGEAERTVPLGACPRPAAGAAALYAELVANAGEVLAARVSRLPRCGGEVRARVFGDTARCRRCGHRWDGIDEVRKLGAQLGDAMADLPGIARYLGVESLATLRSWAHRDGWHREKQGRRTLYRLADARDSWWRAFERRQAAAARSVEAGDEQGRPA